MRILFFIIILFTGLALPWWVFIPSSIVYAFIYRVDELLLVGLCIDLLFGNNVPWLPVPYVYTFSMVSIYLCMWGMKPLLAFYGDVESL